MNHQSSCCRTNLPRYQLANSPSFNWWLRKSPNPSSVTRARARHAVVGIFGFGDER